MAADVIHARHKFSPWKRRFKGEVAEGTFADEKVLLLKPLTFMNDSGRSVQEAAHFYKIAPKDIVVIHDEVDLPPAKMRVKAGGGTAGHNGLRSIGAAIGEDFRRIRIGIGHPGRKEAVPHYVLHDFAKADTEWLVPLLDAIADNAALLAEDKDATFANRIHTALAPGKPAKAAKAQPGKAPVPEAPPQPQPTAKPKPPEGPLARGLRKLFGRS
jgi:PTH1 family peptidyl-tRNA hydrolase